MQLVWAEPDDESFWAVTGNKQLAFLLLPSLIILSIHPSLCCFI